LRVTDGVGAAVATATFNDVPFLTTLDVVCEPLVLGVDCSCGR